MRVAVDWFVPGTMVGDGGPYRGTLFVEAESPIAAWDGVEDGSLLPAWWEGPGKEVIVRAFPADDVQDFPHWYRQVATGFRPTSDTVDMIAVALEHTVPRWRQT